MKKKVTNATTGVFEVDMDTVFENPANPRTIKAGAFKKLVKSIGDFPEMLWKRPPVCETQGDGRYMALGGNKRSEAARKAGLKRIPIMLADDWTADQKKRFVALDNDQSGEWDFKMLVGQYGLSFILEQTSIVLPASMARSTDGREDQMNAPPENPGALLGDVWLLGTHRLACGDSTSAEHVTRLLAGATPNLMVTDPPYGVEYDPDWRNRAFGESGRSVGVVTNDDKADWTQAWALYAGDVAYVWRAGVRAGEVVASLLATGLEVRGQIVWAKPHFAISRGHYHIQHEPCWYTVRHGRTANWLGDRSQTSLWEIGNGLSQSGPRGDQDAQTEHSTQKPVECMERPIRNHRGDVYEPFAGSGTTIIAAERQGRRCFAMELEPRYVQVAIERWQAYTGKEATLEGDGRTFAAVREERLRK